jgi:hypothetical protein
MLLLTDWVVLLGESVCVCVCGMADIIAKGTVDETVTYRMA